VRKLVQVRMFVTHLINPPLASALTGGRFCPRAWQESAKRSRCSPGDTFAATDAVLLVAALHALGVRIKGGRLMIWVRLFWSDAESPELQPIRGQKARLPSVLPGLEPRASPDLA